MSWEVPWVKRKNSSNGGYIIASIHQEPNEADITDVSNDSAYVCEKHADMIVMAVSSYPLLIKALEEILDPKNMPAACTLNEEEWVDFYKEQRRILDLAKG